MPVYLVLGLIFAIAVAVFAVQNATRVDITLLMWQLKSISLVLVILGSALIGALSAGLFGIVKQLKLIKKLRDSKNVINTQEAEIDYLKKKIAKEESKESGEKTLSTGE